MKRSKIAAAALALGAAVSFIGPVVLGGPAYAQEQVATPEARARAIVASLASPATFETAAQQNYTAALLAQKQPAERAQLAQRVASAFGPMQVTNVAANGNVLRVTVQGQTGTMGLFTITFEDSGEHRISEIHIGAAG